jgi:uroporphyrinogen III methyltransferase / synthase
VVTRARAQAGPLASALVELGAEIIPFAAIRIEPVPDPEPLLRAVRSLGDYDWVVFTSANGVDHFGRALTLAGLDARALARTRVCAIGPATAAAARELGVPVHLVAERHLAEGAAEALLAAGVGAGYRVLLPRAQEGRALLPDALRAAGARVDDVAAYRTVVDGEGSDAAREALARGRVAAVTFTAASTVRAFVDRVGTELGGALTASIGPATSAALLSLGLSVDVEAAEHTVPGLVRALVERLSGDADAE